MAWRGKDYFFRPCSKTGKQCISIYPPDEEMVTYSADAFYAPDWTGLEFGRDFDFNRPFFEQFFEFWYSTPKQIANAYNNENCDYLINAHRNKSCYLVDEIDVSRDCYYGYNIQHCESIVNGFYARKSQYCYEVSQIDNCYEVFFGHNIYHSSNCAFVRNCRNCNHCLFCTNLREADYHIFNKKVSKEEFEKAWTYVFSGSSDVIDECRSKYNEFLKSHPVPAVIQINAEDCTGDQVTDCQRCTDSFNIDHCRDCRYCTDIHYSNDAYDVHIYEGDVMYESLHTGPKGYNQLFSHLAWFCHNTLYCSQMISCRCVFGCSGLKNQEYCVFNKKYSEKEYEKLTGRIIEHMQNTGEWGEFFPIELSPLGYNQTMAASYYPLEKDEALKQGFRWKEPEDQYKGMDGEAVPRDLADVPEDIAKRVYKSNLSDAKFKITASETEFHKKYGIPLPLNAPTERMQSFIDKNPRKLWKRSCDKCSKEMETMYSPDRPEKIYCEECYLKEVY